MTLITSIGQQLSSYWQIGQNAVSTTTQAAPVEEAETSPPIIVDISGDATSGSNSEGTSGDSDPPEKTVAPTSQSGSQITASPGAGDKQAPTIASQRSARVEAQAEADASLEASRAAAEAMRTTLLRDATVASVGKVETAEPLIKPIETDAPERADSAYGSSADSKASAEPRRSVNIDV